MKLLALKVAAFLLVLLLVPGMSAAEESAGDKAGHKIQKAGEATERGIKKGAKAVGNGLNKAGEATAKGVKKAGKWVGEKVDKITK